MINSNVFISHLGVLQILESLVFFFSSLVFTVTFSSTCAILPNIDRLLWALRGPAPAMLLIQEHKEIACPHFFSPN